MELPRVIDVFKRTHAARGNGTGIAAHFGQPDTAPLGILLPQEFQPLFRYRFHLHPSKCSCHFRPLQLLMEPLHRLLDHRVILEAVQPAVILEEPLLTLRRMYEVHGVDAILGDADPLFRSVTVLVEQDGPDQRQVSVELLPGACRSRS